MDVHTLVTAYREPYRLYYHDLFYPAIFISKRRSTFIIMDSNSMCKKAGPCIHVHPKYKVQLKDNP